MGGPGGHRGFGPGHGPGLAAAAKKLGVSTAKLRAALKTVMEQQRSAHEKAEAAALAKALGLPESKVAAALAKVRPDKGERKERRLDRSGFVKQLAAALNKKPAAVRKALKARSRPAAIASPRWPRRSASPRPSCARR